MSSEVFGVTHKLNKFRPRLRGRSLNLFFEFVALSNRQIFGASRINSKRYVKVCWFSAAKVHNPCAVFLRQ